MKCKLLILLLILLLPIAALADVHTVENEQLLLTIDDATLYEVLRLAAASLTLVGKRAVLDIAHRGVVDDLLAPLSLTEAAEAAIANFALNLKPLLMQRPVKGFVTMGLDPGYRNGCKVAVVDGTGLVLDTTVVYPTFSVKKKIRFTNM